MTVSFELPSEIERQLKIAFGDLGEAAKHAFLISAYRQGTISIGRLAETLGIGVLEAQQWLSERGVVPNYGFEEYRADCQTIGQISTES